MQTSTPGLPAALPSLGVPAPDSLVAAGSTEVRVEEDLFLFFQLLEAPGVLQLLLALLQSLDCLYMAIFPLRLFLCLFPLPKGYWSPWIKGVSFSSMTSS